MNSGTNKYLGLLRWSLQYSDVTVNKAKPMDQERRKWLMEAIEANVVDPVEQMQNIMKVLETPQQIDGQFEGEEEPIQSYIVAISEAFDHLLEYVEHIDLAKDFVKLEGFKLLLNHLESEHAKLRAKSAEAIAAVVQNHPELQEKAHDAGFLKALVEAWNNGEPEEQVKLLLAMSSLVRGSSQCTKSFVRDYKGIPLLLKALSSVNDEDKYQIKLQRKILFFLRYIFFAIPQIRPVLANSLSDSLAPLTLSKDIDIRESSLMLLEQFLSDVASRKQIENLRAVEEALEDYQGKMKLAEDDPAVSLATKLSKLCEALESEVETDKLTEGTSLTDNVFAEDQKSEPMKLLKL